MKLSLLANAALKPLIDALHPYSVHEMELTVLSDHPQIARAQIREAAEQACDADAVLVLDGYDLLSEESWQNGDVPLVVPRVHNVAGLILGDEDIFCCLFRLYDGGLCWFLPSGRREYNCTPIDDCQALCHLVITQVPMRDESLTARAMAQYRGWDYFEQECNLSLLESLLGGEWKNCAYVFAPGETVKL